jgi:sugar phosphate isomerase/epimerase
MWDRKHGSDATPMTGPPHLSRRDLLKAAAHGGAALATAALAGCSLHGSPGSPSSRTINSAAKPGDGPRLGLDTYTLHRCLTAKDPGNRHDLWWVIDRLGELGLSGLQIDPSHFPGNDEGILQRLDSAVRPRGYYVEFGMGGWDPERLKQRIRLTARFGGRAVRTFCGDEKAGAEQITAYLRWAPPALRQAADAAEEYGVTIAVENHGEFTAAQLKALLDRVGHPRVGACLDTGNSLFQREDPVECARILAPYACSMHLKDWTMTFQPDGTPKWREAVLGTGQVPVKEILRIVVAQKRDLYIAMEAPIQPGGDETETVRREWRNATANAAAARRILAEL